MPKTFILELIDLIALHKCNVLHLHLTDDQGWRIEIEGYPRLTEIGAWRRESDGSTHYGGFYTRDDLEEIVAYARERHVRVLPEIDMPGHMVAAIAAYPALGNTEERPGVDATWGVSTHVLNLEDATCASAPTSSMRSRASSRTVRTRRRRRVPDDGVEDEPRAQEIMRDEGYADEANSRAGSASASRSISQHAIADRRVGRRAGEWRAVGRDPDGVARRSERRRSRRGRTRRGDGPQQWLYFDRPESATPMSPSASPA